MKWGLIARADNGGIGTQTVELARHLHPDRVLLIQPPPNAVRGRSYPGRYADWEVVSAGLRPSNAEIGAFLAGLDVIFTVEGVYRDGLGDIAARQGCALIVQANPELYRPRDLGTHHVVLPTSWRADRFPPNTPILAVPVNREVLPERRVERVRSWLHLCAPAMADRAGTNLVAAAAKFCQEPQRVVVNIPRGMVAPACLADRGRRFRIGEVSIELRRAEVTDYWALYGDDVDALLSPRRYGGLSLPMQEAASRGMPIVALELDPQKHWGGIYYVPPGKARAVPMKGGRFDVWDADPHDLAMAMDTMVREPRIASALSVMAGRWAESLNWTRWTEPYRATLAAAVS